MAKKSKNDLKKLQSRMFRIQQGVWHSKERVIIAIEGFDAAGKGGAIRRVTGNLDPRGVRVHPIGPPAPRAQGKHWLYRFWKKLPAKGIIAIFDRTWYGRVLVERVEKLTDKKNWKRAFTEINQFEKLLLDDGVKIIKIYLKISKEEQLKRFEQRLADPYKHWKITDADVRNRSLWDEYLVAVDEMVKKTNTKHCPWHMIETDDKDESRQEVLEIITKRLSEIGDWMEEEAHRTDKKALRKKLAELD
jgi:polyphosphate kinase 2 (PPK2 family)